jgi:hypothetical protein
MTQRVTGQRFRQRKLSTKQNLPVLREHEVEKLADDEASRHIPRVETGVEKGEEIVSFPLSRFGRSLSKHHLLLGWCCGVAHHTSSQSYLVMAPPMLIVSIGAPSPGRHICRAGSSPGLNWRKDCTALHPDSGCRR